jgi:succinyl-diaminopimelate desuccinylase
VIPAKTSATFNARFNDLHTAESLEAKFRQIFDAVGGRYDFKVECTSNAFVTEPGPLSDAVAAAVKEVTGKDPELSTSGGTSDARFIRKFCPVVEFGIVGQTMHKTDEHVTVTDIEALTDIYETALGKFFD